MRLITGIFKLIGHVIKFVFEIAVFLIVLAACIYIYARYIEPKLLIVQREEIKSSSLQKNTKPFKIVQFSDTHLGEGYTVQDLEKAVQKMNAEKPDVIVFSGDLIDDNANYEHEEAITKELTKLKASLGKIAVYGNHDHGGNGTKRYKRIMEAAGFTLLKNSSLSMSIGKNQKINFMGLDDLLLGDADLKKTVKSLQPKDYNIMIAHEPDIADKVKAYAVDLQLSGHSHGGQVAVPFWGAPFTPPYADKYVKGMYQIEGNKRMKLYVNRGIGTSQVRYRFWSVPEITVFTVSTENKD